MKQILFGIVLSIVLGFISLKSPTIISFMLGTKSCNVKYSANANAVATLLALHDDENTAIEAFNNLPKDIIFNLFELNQSGERKLTYQLIGKNYKFDPNRIFSDEGINSELEKSYGEYVPEELNKGIQDFSIEMLKAFTVKNPSRYIISIHNNKNGYGGIKGTASILHYSKGKNANDVYISNGKLADDLDDYFVVTQQSDFNTLKNLNKNVALEIENPKDDGSLSIYCRKNNIPYINIEAEISHMHQQIAMMKIVYRLVKAKNEPKQ